MVGQGGEPDAVRLTDHRGEGLGPQDAEGRGLDVQPLAARLLRRAQRRPEVEHRLPGVAGRRAGPGSPAPSGRWRSAAPSPPGRSCPRSGRAASGRWCRAPRPAAQAQADQTVLQHVVGGRPRPAPLGGRSSRPLRGRRLGRQCSECYIRSCSTRYISSRATGGIDMGMAMALLLLAIGIEVGATAALPRTDGFSNPFWTAVVLVGYAASIWLLAIVVRQVPVSVAYAIWAGLGTAAIAVVGVVVLGEHWDLTKVVRARADHRRRGRAQPARSPLTRCTSAQRAQPGLDQGGVQPDRQHCHLVHRLGRAALGAVLAAAPDRGDHLLDEARPRARRRSGRRAGGAARGRTPPARRRPWRSPARRRRSAWSPAACGPGRSSPAGRAAPR